jgi:bilirubin oxidase
MLKKILLLTAIISLNIQAQTAIPIPGTIESTNINLTLQNGTHQFLPGTITNTMGVNGNILGPTLIINKGDALNINVTNNLGQPTTIHWHGMHVTASNDGGPHTVIDPGTTWNPQFTVMNNASTMWYHPHLDTHTDEHASKGIAGMIIIRDTEEAALTLPRTYGVDDFPIVVQTKDLDANNQIVIHANNDDTVMVNATVNPKLDVPAQVVRLRLLNGSTQRVFNFGLSNGATFYQIATDGGLLETPNALTRLQLSSGERAEILVDLSGMNGQTIYLKSFASEFPNGIYGATNPGMGAGLQLDNYNPNTLNGTDFNVLQLDVIATTASPITTIPTTLVSITPLVEANADQTRTLSFAALSPGSSQLNGDFSINGTSFDMNTINITIPLDNTEVWTIANNTPIAHPIHIHDIQFQILEIDGVAAGAATFPANAKGWQDTYLVPAGSSIKLITKFEDFADDTIPFMYHCHMLTHEDGGMMGSFAVVDNSAYVAEYSFENGAILYPNPSNGVYMTLQLADNTDVINSYSILNEAGQIVAHHKVHENELNAIYSFPVFELAKGNYIIKAYTNNKIITKKFIKK